MTARPVTLPANIAWRPWCSLELLYLGEVPVGRVLERGGHKSQPAWFFDLDHHTAIWRTAKTVEDARAQVEAKLADWLRRAGLA